MKRTFWLGSLIAVALIATGCGSSGSSTTTPGGGSTTPTSATQAQNLSASKTMASMAYTTVLPAVFNESAPLPMKEMAKALGIKSSEGGSCSSYDPLTCTISGSSGGTCTVTGSAPTQNSATLTLDCQSYASGDTTIDGSFSITLTLNEAFLQESQNAAMSKAFDQKTSSECSIDESNYEDLGDGCSFSDTACAAADALITMSFTIGNSGLSVTDECGTFAFSANFSMDANLCLTPWPNPTSSSFTITVEGSINGDAMNETSTVACTN